MEGQMEKQTRHEIETGGLSGRIEFRVTLLMVKREIRNESLEFSRGF